MLTEIDFKATMKKKLDVDFQKYVILGAQSAAGSPRAERRAGYRPVVASNVIVYEDEAGGSVVSLVDPIAMLGFVDNPALAPVAQEARTDWRRSPLLLPPSARN